VLLKPFLRFSLKSENTTAPHLDGRYVGLFRLSPTGLENDPASAFAEETESTRASGPFPFAPVEVFFLFLISEGLSSFFGS
jgi:hypothetical protein